MKKTIFFWLLISLASSLQAQPSYCDTIFIELIKDFKANELSEALEELKRAELCDYGNQLTKQRQEWRDSIFNAINQQKQNAIQAQLAEKKATQKARKAEGVAIDERQKALIEKENAIRQRNRADSLKNIARQQQKKAERAAAISTAGLQAQQGDVANRGGNYKEGFRLALSAIQLAEQNDFEIPLIAHTAFGEAIYRAPNLGYKKNIDATNTRNLLYFQPLSDDRLFLVYDNHQLVVFDVKDSTRIQQQASGRYLLDFQISANQQWISICQEDGQLLLWDIERNKLSSIQAHQQEVLGACFSNDSQRILTWSRENAAKLWALDSTLLQRFDVGSTNKVYQGSFNKKDEQIVLRTSNWQTIIYNLNDSKRTIIAHDSYVLYAAFTPDGEGVLSCSSDHTTKLYRPNQPIISLPHQDSPVLQAYFSSSGDFFATIDLNSTIRVWNKDGTVVATKSTEHQLKDLLFTKHGEIIFCNAPNKIYKWDFQQDKLTPFLEGHVAGILAIQQSKDGQYFLTHARDGTAKLWDQDGQLLMSVDHLFLFPKLSVDGMALINCPNSSQLEVTRNPEKVLIDLRVK